MKIALIDGSPKASNSSSEAALQILKPLLTAEHEIVECQFKASEIRKDDLEKIAECQTLVFAFPLYVDGIPSHLIACLCELERFIASRPKQDIIVYALVNCGFFEGHQNVLALEMMKNWCQKAKLNWGHGIGIGGGGMLPTLAGIQEGHGPKKNLWRAMTALANNLTSDTPSENMFISPNFPRFAYKLAAEYTWRQSIKANGLRIKDLSTRK